MGPSSSVCGAGFPRQRTADRDRGTVGRRGRGKRSRTDGEETHAEARLPQARAGSGARWPPRPDRWQRPGPELVGVVLRRRAGPAATRQGKGVEEAKGEVIGALGQGALDQAALVCRTKQPPHPRVVLRNNTLPPSGFNPRPRPWLAARAAAGRLDHRDVGAAGSPATGRLVRPGQGASGTLNCRYCHGSTFWQKVEPWQSVMVL
jgi:hypothetical protein